MGGDAHPTERRGRLPKQIVFGNLEGAVRRGRCGKEKEWIDCVQGEVRAFGIAGDWKATAVQAGVRVETLTEGRRMSTAASRKEEIDAARHRLKRETIKIREVVIVHESVKPTERHHLA